MGRRICEELVIDVGAKLVRRFNRIKLVKECGSNGWNGAGNWDSKLYISCSFLRDDVSSFSWGWVT